MIPAVIYAAKSTEDRHLSIPGQLQKCREVADERGWTIVDDGEFKDEGFSAYSGNRGPGLADARRRAAEVAVEYATDCMLLVRRADRISRGAGDRPGAPEALVEIWHQERRRKVHLRSALPNEDHDFQTSAGVANMGQRAHDDSDLKGESVREGLARRRDDRGEPVGAVPHGYRVERYVTAEGKAASRRVIDPEGRALYDRMTADAERGLTPGTISRAINADGYLTRRGKRWTTRAVRAVLANDDYLGDTGYPPLIDRDRWDAIQRQLTRMDPAAVQARKGGRTQRGDYLLAGVVFCGFCGGAMRSHRVQPKDGRLYRYYRCRNTSEGIALCKEARPIVADVLESQVLEHLERVADEQLRRWLADRAEQHRRQRDDRGAVVGRERAALVRLDQRERAAMYAYLKVLDTNPDLAPIALGAMSRVKADADAQRERLADAEARAAEFAEDVDDHAAVEQITRLQDALTQRLREAGGPAEINAVLRDALEGIYASRNDVGVTAEIVARTGDWATTKDWADVPGLTSCMGSADMDALDALVDSMAVGQTERQTFV